MDSKNDSRQKQAEPAGVPDRLGFQIIQRKDKGKNAAKRKKHQRCRPILPYIPAKKPGQGFPFHMFATSHSMIYPLPTLVVINS